MVGKSVNLKSFSHKTTLLATALTLITPMFSINLAGAAVRSLPTDNPSVHIIPGSVINLVSSESKIPVRIRNDFDSEVRIQVHMLPSNPRVTVPSAVEVVIPAQSGINAQVPVKAIGNGKVFLAVWLTTFSGLRITETTHLQMNVNAEIEFTLLLVFGAGVIALGTIGVLRTRTKLRRKTRLEIGSLSDFTPSEAKSE